MYYTPNGAVLFSWREHSRCSKRVVLLRGAQALKVAVLLAAQSLCMAAADNGYFYGSSSCSLPVELHRVRFATACVRIAQIRCARLHLT